MSKRMLMSALLCLLIAPGCGKKGGKKKSAGDRALRALPKPGSNPKVRWDPLLTKGAKRDIERLAAKAYAAAGRIPDRPKRITQLCFIAEQMEGHGVPKAALEGYRRAVPLLKETPAGKLQVKQLTRVARGFADSGAATMARSVAIQAQRQFKLAKLDPATEIVLELIAALVSAGLVEDARRLAATAGKLEPQALKNIAEQLARLNKTVAGEKPQGSLSQKTRRHVQLTLAKRALRRRDADALLKALHRAAALFPPEKKGKEDTFSTLFALESFLQLAGRVGANKAANAAADRIDRTFALVSEDTRESFTQTLPWVLWRAGLKKRAVALLKQKAGRVTDPGDALGLVEYAEIAAKMGHAKLALRWHKQAVSRAPSPLHPTWKALLLAHLGRFAEALTIAATLGPARIWTHPRIPVLLAMAERLRSYPQQLMDAKALKALEGVLPASPAPRPRLKPAAAPPP